MVNSPDNIDDSLDRLFLALTFLRMDDFNRAVEYLAEKPTLSVWFVNQGRLAIEVYGEEDLDSNISQLLTLLIQYLQVQKEAMYRYLCIAEIRGS